MKKRKKEKEEEDDAVKRHEDSTFLVFPRCEGAGSSGLQSNSNEIKRDRSYNAICERARFFLRVARRHGETKTSLCAAASFATPRIPYTVLPLT